VKFVLCNTTAKNNFGKNLLAKANKISVSSIHNRNTKSHIVSSIHNCNTKSHIVSSVIIAILDHKPSICYLLLSPKYSTLRTQKALTFEGSKIWNSISPELRNQSSNNFKTQLKKQLLEGYNS